MIARTAVVAAMVCLLVGAAEPSPTDGAGAEMKKVDWLVGRWKGEGWIQMGPQRREFAGTETVQRKTGGLTVLIEGNFREKGAGPDAPPIHDTLAVMWYDPAQGHHWVNAWLATGRSGQFEARVVSETEVQWFIPLPQGAGQIRYTMKLDGQGRWAETGEMSPDGGKTWRKFFEMTLAKVKD
jgi:hypothetical protein